MHYLSLFTQKPTIQYILNVDELKHKKIKICLAYKNMSTNSYKGASARRNLMMQPIGAGGFASSTVDPAQVDRVVGAMGLNSETSPVIYHDDEGRPQKRTLDGTFRPAHMEVVKSWRRDPDNYINTSFRLSFSKPMRGVECIELLEINLPNVDATPPANREYLLLLGLIDQNGDFVPQQNLPKDFSLHTMVADSANDPGVAKSSAAWQLAQQMQLDDYALFIGTYDSTKALQYWKREGWHRKIFFPTPISELANLEFTLMDSQGTLYDMASADEWSATLQIYSQQ